MSAKKNDAESERIIATNPSAHKNFVIIEIVEAGLVLTGTEIKSLRAQAPTIKESYVEVAGKHDRLEAWLVNAHIGPYSHGNIWNHEALRRRKLLLHRHQIDRLLGATTREGMTAIPTRMYFKKGRAKVEIALAKGKKHHDKRDTMIEKSANREIDRALKHKQRSKA